MTDTFGIFTNTGLTTNYGGSYSLIHKTDQSDNPQDLGPLYIGSLGSAGGDTADRKLQATSSPGVDNIVLSVVDILPIWVVATAYTVGQRRQPTASNTYVYTCTTAGTSHASTEPTWPLTLGSTVVDNTCIWTCTSKKHVTTEIVLAATSGDLATNTPGASLSLGNTITSGTTNEKLVYIRVINSVNTVGNDSAEPEIAIAINGVTEYTV